jgi:hypothetical protein
MTVLLKSCCKIVDKHGLVGFLLIPWIVICPPIIMLLINIFYQITGGIFWFVYIAYLGMLTVIIGNELKHLDKDSDQAVEE